MRFWINTIFLITVCTSIFLLYRYLYPEKKIAYTPGKTRTPAHKTIYKTPSFTDILLNEKMGEKIQIPEHGAYLGISLYERNINYLASLENLLNKHFAIVATYQSWGDAANKFNLEWVNTLRDKNSTALISWEPWVPISGYDRSESIVDQKDYRLINIINGSFDNYIRQYAKDVKSYKKQIIIRFAHEMNGNWYPWGSKFNTYLEYIAAWKHVHNIFTEEGATNVTWLWSPNEIYIDENVPYADKILEFYPGDKYVDWVGFSSFNWGGRYKHNMWREPEAMYTETIKVLLDLNKPIVIAETASADYNTDKMKANWISALATYIKSNAAIKGILWFNVEDNGINWKIESSALSIAAFSKSFDDYFTQYYKE